MSWDGLVLGKMGHSERTVGIGGFEPNLIKNIARYAEANSCQNLFRAGVRYFAFSSHPCDVVSKKSRLEIVLVGIFLFSLSLLQNML